MKTKQTHTPGPWKVTEYHDDVIGIKVGESPICDMAGHHNRMADASLIASAPDLLEACKKLLSITIPTGELAVEDAINTAIKAIAKARGEV